MERMEHLHAKLREGEATLLDDVDCYLGYHARTNGHKSYFGYFEATADRMVAVHQGGPFQLILSDGRTADVYIDVHPSNRAGVMTAEFHICGALIDTARRIVAASGGGAARGGGLAPCAATPAPAP